MSKADGSKSFPLAELILYTLLSYIYIILCAEGTTLSMSSSVHFYMLCAYRLPYPRSVPIFTESAICSLDLLRMIVTHWLLTPASTFSFPFYVIPFMILTLWMYIISGMATRFLWA